MSLAEKLASIERKSGCRVRDILDELPNEDAVALEVALANPAWSNRELSLLLRSEGHQVGRTTIGVHRRKECNCELEEKVGGSS